MTALRLPSKLVFVEHLRLPRLPPPPTNRACALDSRFAVTL